MRTLLSSRAARRFGSALPAALALLLVATNSEASWPPLGSPGVTVCDLPGNPNQPASAPDGHGGVFLGWLDRRAGGDQPRIYAQHVDGSGTPLWTEDGLLLNSSRVIDPPRLVSDGADGVIVVWRDFRADTAGNVYAQRLSSAGARLWDANDVVVAAGPLHETMLAACTDGAGGAFVSWSDDRTGTSDIRVQRLTPDGGLDWGPDGVAMGTAWISNNPITSLVSTDGAGGALVGYPAFEGGSFHAIVQRLSSTGTPRWTNGGVSASTSTLGTNCVGLDADGTGGALVAIQDNRSQNSWQQAFSQRIAADGSLAWAADGVSLSGSTYPSRSRTWSRMVRAAATSSGGAT